MAKIILDEAIKNNVDIHLFENHKNNMLDGERKEGVLFEDSIRFKGFATFFNIVNFLKQTEAISSFFYLKTLKIKSQIGKDDLRFEVIFNLRKG